MPIEAGTPSAPATPRKDPLRQPRLDFYATFEHYCPLPLLPDAERKLAEIFEQTVVHAVDRRGVDWATDPRKTVALNGIRDIAILCRRNAPLGVAVTESTLVSAADTVICAARNTCEALLRRGSAVVIDFVFCEAYEGNCDAIAAAGDVQGGAGAVSRQGAGGNGAPAPGPVERAHDDFVTRAHQSALPRSFTDEGYAFMEFLFTHTVRYAIEQAGVDWDHDAKRRKYALRRLGEIAELASQRAAGDRITGAELKAAADQVICLWKPSCTAFVPRFVFCEDYTKALGADPCPDAR